MCNVFYQCAKCLGIRVNVNEEATDNYKRQQCNVFKGTINTGRHLLGNICYDGIVYTVIKP